MNDDGYQGIATAAPLSASEAEIAGLQDQITRLDEQAWAYEDREQLSKASATRAKIRPLRERLAALRAAS